MTSKETLCYINDTSRLARMVEGKVKQQFDKDGNLFIDCDPKAFGYVLKALRKRGGIIKVPREAIDDVRATANSLGLSDSGFKILD